MVTLQSAEQALKTVYLGVVTDQLNTTVNPLYSMIKQSTKDVWGKEVRKLARYTLSNGIGVGDEDGDLPVPVNSKYQQIVATLKNLYGQISISDKAIRASQSSEGAFVNLLNDEMDALLKASRLNLGRMMFGRGDGYIGTVAEYRSDTICVGVLNGARLLPGTKIKICSGSTIKENNLEVMKVAVADGMAHVYLDREIKNYEAGDDVFIIGCEGKEITGLEAVMKLTGSIYGLNKLDHYWLIPHSVSSPTGKIDEISLQGLVDALEDNAGSRINLIISSSGVRRNYMKEMLAYRRNVDVLSLETGYKAISFNGIPFVADRFCESGTLYALNTDDFCLHQLCDWKWLENENGRILHKNQGKATYNATLVKYAEMICDRPMGQGKLTDISEIA